MVSVKDFSILNLIGCGGYGDVFKAMANKNMPPLRENDIVALKIVNKTKRKSIEREVNVSIETVSDHILVIVP